VPGAPTLVNAGFPAQVAAGSPFFVRCTRSSATGSAASPATSFGDGLFRVGSDIRPGRYRTAADPTSCRWARLRGFSGEPALASDLTAGSVIVDILPSDAGFRSEGCGSWTVQLSRPDRADPTAPFGSGDWIVGADVAPGTWQSSGGGGGCSWERVNAFTGALTAVLGNGNALGVRDQTVTIQPGDVGFRSVGCDSWTFIG